MVSDQEIAESLGSLFRETNPNSFTTLNDIVLRLQSKLGYDLSHKLDFIRSQINLIFYPYQPQPQLPPQQQQPPPPPLPQPSNPTHHSNPIFRAAPSHYHPQPQQGHHVFRSNATEINFAQPHSQPLAATSHAGHNATPKDSSQSKPKRRGGPGGLNKLCGVSPELQVIVGEPTMPRTQIVKELWAYIRKNNLQDPSNKRKIICNDELRMLFKTDSTDMFQMNKLLSKHILRLEPPKETVQKSKKLKVEEAPDVKPTESNPVIISDALANFFNTSEKEMPQAEVFGRLSEYIKVQGLEDTLNSMVVCDAKLQDLFGCENIPASGLYDILARNHLFQRS